MILCFPGVINVGCNCRMWIKHVSALLVDGTDFLWQSAPPSHIRLQNLSSPLSSLRVILSGTVLCKFRHQLCILFGVISGNTVTETLQIAGD